MVTSNISHWWVFCHTSQSTERQLPGVFVLDLHLSCYEFITLGFLQQSESYYTVMQHIIIEYQHLNENSQKIKIRIRITLKLEEAKGNQQLQILKTVF